MINDLQSSYSFGEYVKQYIDESVSPLANAGQRFGINGNGIKYVNKTCAEIFGLTYYSNINDLLLEFHTNNNSLQNIKILNKKTGKIEETIYEIQSFTNQVSIQSILNNNTNETINNLINFSFNDIDGISDDSYIIINNSIFTGFIKGKLNGTNDNEPNSKLIYFQYETNTNKLLHYIITKPYGKIANNNDWYIVYKLDYKYNNIYDLSIYLFRLEWLYNHICNNFLETIDNDSLIYYKNLLSNLYSFNYNSIDNPTLSFFNNTFENYDNFTYDGPLIDKISFLNFIFNYDYSQRSNGQHQFKTIEIEYEQSNFQENDLHKIFDDQTNDILGYISKEELILFFINLQNIYNIYYQLFLYYNQNTYFNTNNNSYIYKYIIYRLFQNLREEFNIDSNDVLYIPLSYTFNCFISDINEANLYYINNIYVKFLNNINYLNNVVKSQIYYVHNYLTNHTSIYNIHVDYNSISNDIINNILINKLYTLPYLNKLNNWVIDDIDTSSSINQNEYSGIKELYIYNTTNDNNKIYTEILNFSDDSINRYFTDFDTKEFIVNSKYFVKYNEVNVKCKVLIPNLSNATEDIIEFFKNTIIIAICDKKLLNQNYAEDYKLDYIYSLWKFDEHSSESGEFKLITLNNDKTHDNIKVAFDPFNNLSYINNNQTYNYIQSLLTTNEFDTNQSSMIEESVSMLMRNKHGSQYNTQYNNNYNAIIEYIPESNIKSNGNDPNYKLDKYINTISNTPITNVLYPIYDIVFKYQQETQFKTYIKQVNQLKYTTYITVLANGEDVYHEMCTTQNVDNVWKSITEKETIYNTIEIAVSLNNNYDNNNQIYYDEFIFNKNVPTIDYKEIFLRNINTLNRVNILGVSYEDSDQSDTETKIYNGYIGTKYTDKTKDTLYISTDNQNINVGTDTLLNSNQIKKFNKYQNLQIDGFNNINLVVDNENNIKISKDNVEINSKSVLLQSKNPLELDTKIYIDNNIIHKSEKIISNDLQSINTYSTSVIPQGHIKNKIYICHNFDNVNKPLNLYVYSFDNIIDSLFIPIYGVYTKQNQNQSNTINNTSWVKSNSYYFYNSINLNILLKDIFGSKIVQNQRNNILYPITYKCNLNNKVLNLNISGIYYNLLIFNDINDIYQDPTELKSFYNIFNHKLNITLVESQNLDTNTNEYNKEFVVYINFENDKYDTLNNTYNQTNHDVGSLYNILNDFNKMITLPNKNININVEEFSIESNSLINDYSSRNSKLLDYINYQSITNNITTEGLYQGDNSQI